MVLLGPSMTVHHWQSASLLLRTRRYRVLIAQQVPCSKERRPHLSPLHQRPFTGPRALWGDRYTVISEANFAFLLGSCLLSSDTLTLPDWSCPLMSRDSLTAPLKQKSLSLHKVLPACTISPTRPSQQGPRLVSWSSSHSTNIC